VQFSHHLPQLQQQQLPLAMANVIAMAKMPTTGGRQHAAATS